MATVNIKEYHNKGTQSKIVKKAQKLEQDIRVHLDGLVPKELVSKRRPNESKDAQKYREEIWQAVTKQFFSGVIMSLQKIRKSDDYVYRWNENARPVNVASDELLRTYIEQRFPLFTSLDNWYWSVCFRNAMADGNAVSIVWPENIEKQDNEYFRPVPHIFSSSQIREHRPGELIVVKSDEEAYYVSGNRQYEAAVYYSADKESIVRYVQSDAKGNFQAFEFFHNLGYLPVVSLRGEVTDVNASGILAVSRLYGMVPYLNEAAREYSDMQLEVVQHIHSTLWTVQAAECKDCKGVGSVPSQEGPVKCPSCKGKGHYPMNPGEIFVLRTPGPGESQVPTPPAGFIQKDIEIAKLQNERIISHFYNAYSAINFEWKMNVPLSQSGIAKQFDRAEFTNFVYTVAEDAVRHIDEHIRIICDYRYAGVITDPVRRKEMLPVLSVPVKYDILPEGYLTDEIKKLRDAKVSPVIINAAEIEYANKKFNADPSVRDRVKATYEIDPFAGVPEDELLVRLQNGVISKEAYYLHANILYLIDEAIAADTNFLSYPVTQKREILLDMARQELTQMLPSSQVLNALSGLEGGAAGNDPAAS